MSYDGKILRRAAEQYESDKAARSAQFAARREKLFCQIPELEEIDRQLRGTMSEIISSALRRGTDPLPAIRVIRDKNLSLQQRRAELLRQAGYPEDALEEKPSCPLCGDTGYRGGEMCRCLRQYYSREQIRELSKLLDMGGASFETFSFAWYSSEPGELGISPRENMERNYDICQDYAYQFGPRSGNLLLCGEPGLGKTFLSACVARVVSENGFSVVYDTAAHVFSRFESDKFQREDGEDAQSDVNRCMQCDLLILDDLGTEMTTSFVQSALYQIVNGRLLSGKKTLINTNLSLDEIQRRYSPQIRSRLEGEYQILPFFGEDIRPRKRSAQN